MSTDGLLALIEEMTALCDAVIPGRWTYSGPADDGDEYGWVETDHDGGYPVMAVSLDAEPVARYLAAHNSDTMRAVWAVARAVQTIGPFPIILYDDVYGNWCIHCHASNGSFDINGVVSHESDCGGMALRDSLITLDERLAARLGSGTE